jgi:hypothetical protein
MCENEAEVMKNSLGKMISEIGKLVEQKEVWYEVRKSENGKLEATLKA